MYTRHTYQDWLATPEAARLALLEDIVRTYKASEDVAAARQAMAYFRADGTAVDSKVILQPSRVKVRGEDGRLRSTPITKDVIGNRAHSNFLRRFVVQENQYLLGNGVTLDKEDTKARLGLGFDKLIAQAGEMALLQGVAWGYWNYDHLELLRAYDGDLSGFVALLDERTGAPMVGVQYWQLDNDRPMYVRLFEADGVTEYVHTKDGLRVTQEKRPYKLTVARYNTSAEVIGGENYGGVLPIVPLYASDERKGVLTPAIKSKIDMYERILSDFGDNLDRANDVYWVLSNFGGTTDEIYEMLAEINRIKAVVNISDGTGNASTAEPHTIEVPYQARQAALSLLEKALYADAMALNMDELTGGSLTNVAIEAARTNLNLKCDRFEWQCFAFVQGILRLIGVNTEEISFKRQTLTNRSEIVQDIAAMRQDIDHETALKLNPYITQEEIPEILHNVAAEQMTGAPAMEELERIVREG